MLSKPSVGTRLLGTNLAWLERWKFTMPPYVAGTKQTIGVYTPTWTQDYDGLNEGYWNTYANTQIKDFGDVIIGDVINNPNRRTNFAQEAYIDIINLNVTHTMDSGIETMDSDRLTLDNSDTAGASFDSIGTLRIDNTSLTFDTM
jgi:hypothetical protein